MLPARWRRSRDSVPAVPVRVSSSDPVVPPGCDRACGKVAEGPKSVRSLTRCLPSAQNMLVCRDAYLICNQQVGGSIPFAGFLVRGRISSMKPSLMEVIQHAEKCGVA